MKFFAFIFCCYLLFLAAVPCCRFDNCINETQQSGKHQHNEGCTNCSPFNQCCNCSGFTCAANDAVIIKPQQALQQVFPNTTAGNLPQFFSSFWQPPRLS